MLIVNHTYGLQLHGIAQPVPNPKDQAARRDALGLWPCVCSLDEFGTDQLPAVPESSARVRAWQRFGNSRAGGSLTGSRGAALVTDLIC